MPGETSTERAGEVMLGENQMSGVGGGGCLVEKVKLEMKTNPNQTNINQSTFGVI